MKKRVCLLSAVVMGVVIGLSAVLELGCDEAEGLLGLTIDPRESFLTVSNRQQWFEVVTGTNGTRSELMLPLQWSVSDSSLGSITRQSGYTALYEGTTKNGKNTVIARDQFGNEGFATVHQSVEQRGLSISANPTSLNAGTNTTTLTVSGGVLPISWSVRDEALGRIISRDGGYSAVYQSIAPGSNVIRARDATGAEGNIAIVQQ